MLISYIKGSHQPSEFSQTLTVELLFCKYTDITCTFLSSVKMSDCKANNMTSHSVVDEVSDSGNLYAIPDKSIPNPAYRYFTSNKTEAKTGNPEGPYLNEQPGSVSSQHVKKK